MIKCLLLTLLLTIQKDYQFDLAVEDFVIESYDLTEFVPGDVYKLIKLSSADCYVCRERARKRLVKMGDGVLPWMFWGMHSADAQIRLSCWLVIRELASCTNCHGSGYCNNYIPNASENCIHCNYPSYMHTDEYLKKCKMCELGAINISLLWF